MSFQIPVFDSFLCREMPNNCDDTLEKGSPWPLQDVASKDDLEAESDYDDAAWMADELVCLEVGGV